MSKREIVYVDMDDVLCDYRSAYIEGTEEYKDNPYPQSRIGFFAELKPLPGAIEAFRKLEEKYEVWVLSRPSVKNLHCYTEKAQWIQKHLGEDVLHRLILSSDKSRCIGSYLIDDSTKDGQLQFGGEHIHFGTPKFPDWESVLLYLTGIPKLEWVQKRANGENVYFSNEGEFTISVKRNSLRSNQWVLSYNDYWTVPGGSFYETVYSGSAELLAVQDLMDYAQKVYEQCKRSPDFPLSL